MNIMLIKANQALYASKGVLNDALFQMSCDILGENHQIQVTDTATSLWDVNEEIQKLKRAEAIVYHFPLWWFGLPHLLKKYFEAHLTIHRLAIHHAHRRLTADHKYSSYQIGYV